MRSFAAKRIVQPSDRPLTTDRAWVKDLIEVQEEERRRISQELHDDFGQRLALLEIQMSQLESKCVSADVATSLKALGDRVREMNRDIHRTCYELYPAVLEKLGLIVGLTSLCRDFSEASGICTSFYHENVAKYVPHNVSLCLYRVAQEALHNVSKHARVKEAKVSVSGVAEGIELMITDTGAGFDPFLVRTKKGLGLTTMEERLKSTGGRYSIRSSPGRGTEVKAIVYQQYRCV
jgi:signal transduction histidine kinase